MSRLLEFLLGSLLIPVFTVALVFFSSLHYILRAGGVADCVWQSSVQAWVDANGDGRLNPGESPLRDVEVHVDDMQNQLVNVGWFAITDENGEVQPDIWESFGTQTVYRFGLITER